VFKRDTKASTVAAILQDDPVLQTQKSSAALSAHGQFECGAGELNEKIGTGKLSVEVLPRQPRVKSWMAILWQRCLI
jgi:hypothetical protein